jgi:hypothetical protein
MTVTMKNVVFWDVTPCGSCKNRHFGGKHRHHIKVERNSELGTTSEISYSESSVLTRATRRHNPEDGIL